MHTRLIGAIHLGALILVGIALAQTGLGTALAHDDDLDDDRDDRASSWMTGDGVEHQVMWRWQSLKDYAFATILELRAAYPDKLIASGLEWNVPGHEHCSAGIVAPDAYGIAQFEPVRPR